MAYNLLDLRSRVRVKIKDQSYPSGTIDGFINDAIVEIATLFPFSSLQKVVDGSLVVNEYTSSQQADHEKTSRLVLIDPINASSYVDLTSDRLNSDAFFNLYPVPDASDSSQPSKWTEYGNQLYFNCPVDKAYTLRQFYQKVPDELANDTDVPEIPITFREAIVLGAAYRCEEERQNYDIAGVLQVRFGDKVGDLMMRNVNDTMAGPDTVVMAGMKYD